MLLIVCNIIKIYLEDSDYYASYILNSFTGLVLLFGVAFLCYPKKDHDDIYKTK